ncbi:hypothetical protein PBRA_002654 [Plasmodiophora brassicae]|uniref:Uncharacterized protein n=1 Tax=Plasmodiophora brassicae TaxID=37360 RepID=A0A0G4J605_PLABS|nr:hypothetical protein PBRA_002654 [Plasmodiophora brassicae]
MMSSKNAASLRGSRNRKGSTMSSSASGPDGPDVVRPRVQHNDTRRVLNTRSTCNWLRYCLIVSLLRLSVFRTHVKKRANSRYPRRRGHLSGTSRRMTAVLAACVAMSGPKPTLPCRLYTPPRRSACKKSLSFVRGVLDVVGRFERDAGDGGNGALGFIGPSCRPRPPKSSAVVG